MLQAQFIKETINVSMKDSLKALMVSMLPAGAASSAAVSEPEKGTPQPQAADAAKAAQQQPKEGTPQESIAATEPPRQPPSSERETSSVEPAVNLPPAKLAAPKPAAAGARAERQTMDANKAQSRPARIAVSPAESGAGGASCWEGSSALPSARGRGERDRDGGHRWRRDDRSVVCGWDQRRTPNGGGGSNCRRSCSIERKGSHSRMAPAEPQQERRQTRSCSPVSAAAVEGGRRRPSPPSPLGPDNSSQRCGQIDFSDTCADVQCNLAMTSL